MELSSQGFWKTGIRSDVCQVTAINRAHPQTLAHAYYKKYKNAQDMNISMHKGGTDGSVQIPHKYNKNTQWTFPCIKIK